MKKIILGVAAALLILLILAIPKLYSKEKTTFNLGEASKYPAGSVQLLAPARAVIISDREGIYAISAVCTHRGCLIRESKNMLLCPCHNSQFDLKGDVLKGPARDNLAWLSITRDGSGDLMLDTSKEVPAGTKISLNK